MSPEEAKAALAFARADLDGLEEKLKTAERRLRHWRWVVEHFKAFGKPPCGQGKCRGCPLAKEE